MQVNTVLVAQGGITVPKLDIAIWANSNEQIKTQASAMAAQLSKAGYFNFTVFDLREDGGHVQLLTIKVETPAPVATIRR